jgi:hypothetical protein
MGVSHWQGKEYIAILTDMRHDISRRIVARIIFITGLLIMLLGISILLGTLAGISRISVFGAFFFVIIGSLCAFLAVKLNKRSLYLFFAVFFILVGFFLFLSSLMILPFRIQESWPLLSAFAGLALIPAGWHRYGAIRSRYVVPASAFVILGCGLLIFSMDVVPFSFKQFILNWWPLLMALAGLVLVFISLGTRNKAEDTKP